MNRTLGMISTAAVVIALAAFSLHSQPAAGAQALAAPSPSVSVTTLPALPGSAPPPPAATPVSSSSAGSVVAPPGTVIQVVGDVADPRVLTLKDLQLMRRTSVTLRVVDADGKRRLHTFSGVLLRDLIASVAPIGPGGATDSTRGYAVVESVNGDAVMIGFPEFEEAFNNKQIIVAYMIDGAPFPGQAIGQLIVPEDQTQGRFISAISTIRIGGATP